jgi:hypothetical protein
VLGFAQNEDTNVQQHRGPHIICIDSLSYFLEGPEIKLIDHIIDSIIPNYDSLTGLCKITRDNKMYDYLVFRSLDDSLVSRMYYITDSLLLLKAKSEFLQFYPVENESLVVFENQEFNNLFTNYLNLMRSNISLFESVLSNERKLASITIRNTNGFSIIFVFHDYDNFKSESLKGDYDADLLITRWIWGCLLSDAEKIDCARQNKIGLEIFEDYFVFVFPLYEENQFLGEIHFPVFREL